MATEMKHVDGTVEHVDESVEQQVDETVEHVDETETVETSDDAGLTIDLWTRRPVCGPRTTVINRLGHLRTAGTLADFSITTWPEEVVMSGRNQHSELLETIDRFEQWAAENGVSLRPPFETRTASLLVGESKTVLTTPMMLAAVYEGQDLVGVYPCTDGERTWTIGEFLDALDTEADDSQAPSTDLPGLTAP